MPKRAAIFIQRGALDRKQYAVCLDYCDEQHWTMEHIVPYWAAGDGIALVSNGSVDVIVAAFDSKDVQKLADEVAGHGTVMVVHPQPAVVEPRRAALPRLVVDMILRWFRRGRSVPDIAIDIDSSTSDVRAILRRAGEQPD